MRAQTIIECIKMALTGELPPDANRGKNFIHDPKVQANTETKAAIKMQFQTVNGKVRADAPPPWPLRPARAANARARAANPCASFRRRRSAPSPGSSLCSTRLGKRTPCPATA